MKLNGDRCEFDFNDEDDFSPDSNSVEVAKKAWEWIMNPITIERFSAEIKDKMIMIIQGREGFTYQQEHDSDNLLSLEMFKQFVIETNEQSKERGDESANLVYG